MNDTANNIIKMSVLGKKLHKISVTADNITRSDCNIIIKYEMNHDTFLHLIYEDLQDIQ